MKKLREGRWKNGLGLNSHNSLNSQGPIMNNYTDTAYKALRKSKYISERSEISIRESKPLISTECEKSELSEISGELKFNEYGFVKIFSKRINKTVYLARDPEAAKKVPDLSISGFLPEELEALQGLNDEELAQMIEVRTIFPGVLSIGDSDKSKRG
jgi:hypothetical protein